MIVVKFGGSSVADAERILSVAEIVRSRLARRPLVVVSALAGVTDLLVRAVTCARDGERDRLESTLGELERKHRWAEAAVGGKRRHDLSLEVDALFEDLRQLLRSVRILGEVTPRASDTLLAFGETLSSRIVVAAFRERGLPARWVDPREVLITDRQHGAAEPDVPAVERRSRERLLPILEAGDVPVVGGFVGSTPDARTTTLGRGGSDTSAAVLGAALGAEEIQIWTDVDGLMTADPRWVASARTLERVSFAEAAELAYYGARVLHPASVAAAVEREIPVRVLNSIRPEHPGTTILSEPDPSAPPLVSVASRGCVSVIRVGAPAMRMDPGFYVDVLGSLEEAGVAPDLIASSEVAIAVASGHQLAALERVRAKLDVGARVEILPDRAIVCVVGSGLAGDGRIRSQVLAALAGLEPDLVSAGASATSLAAVVKESRLVEAVCRLHHGFFES